MDVNVIFQNTVSVDDKRNFLVNFKDEEKIINVLLNRKKDYFMADNGCKCNISKHSFSR